MAHLPWLDGLDPTNRALPGNGRQPPAAADHPHPPGAGLSGHGRIL
ncbi:MAG TPA: hypothetical protein PKD75_07330 [Tepidiformaceae bacterium]|mgnify:CR=1 FL=1|nr:hypothetical protein [Tepidiformaceae bacterium]